MINSIKTVDHGHCTNTFPGFIITNNLLINTKWKITQMTQQNWLT